jgi:hypothetical protein
MSTHDLVFSDVSIIYDPKVVRTVPIPRTVTNIGEKKLINLGMYICASSNIGDVDNPADYPPATDYQDLLTWGQKTFLGLEVTGGLKINIPQNDGNFEGYITRSAGATRLNKIPFIDLEPNDSVTFTVLFETPPAISARRLFVNLVLD